MAIDGMKVVDLDSHLVGDLESWEQTIEDRWKPYLPKKLPTKDNERRKTLVGNRIMTGSELGRHKADKKEWVTEADLMPQGRVRNMDLDGIDVAVLSPNSPALDILWFADDPELAAAYARAQNNYMNWYASQQPGRLMWAGVIPLQDSKEAIKELHRSRELAARRSTSRRRRSPARNGGTRTSIRFSTSWRKPTRRSSSTTPRPGRWVTSASPTTFFSRTWSGAPLRRWSV